MHCLPVKLDPHRPLRNEYYWADWSGLPAESAIPSREYGPIMDERKLLKRLARGDVANVAFGDLCTLAEALGFELRRVNGSHHVFAHPDIPQLINLRFAAKPSPTRSGSL